MNIPYVEYFGPPKDEKDHAHKLRRWDALSESDQRFAIGVMLHEVLDRLTPLSISFKEAVRREQEAEERERKEAEEQALRARLERLVPNKPVHAPPPGANGQAPPERANGQALSKPPEEDVIGAPEDDTDVDTVDNPIEKDDEQ